MHISILAQVFYLSRRLDVPNDVREVFFVFLQWNMLRILSTWSTSIVGTKEHRNKKIVFGRSGWGKDFIQDRPDGLGGKSAVAPIEDIGL